MMALPGLPIGVPLVLLFATNLLSPVFGGARAALLPEIVPAHAFVPARSLMRVAAQSNQLIGNAGAGGLLLVLEPRQVLLLDAASFLCSAIVLRLGLRRRPARVVAGMRGVAARLAARRARGAADAAAASGAAVQLAGARVLGLARGAAAPGVAAHGATPGAVGWWLMALPAGTWSARSRPCGCCRRRGGRD